MRSDFSYAACATNFTPKGTQRQDTISKRAPALQDNRLHSSSVPGFFQHFLGVLSGQNCLSSYQKQSIYLLGGGGKAT